MVRRIFLRPIVDTLMNYSSHVVEIVISETFDQWLSGLRDSKGRQSS
jgi:hypothetical protein